MPNQKHVMWATDLAIKSKLKALANFISNKGEVERPKYVHLAPIDNADETGVYSRALNYAVNESNVSNIALTGPYGSGKSSIIKTFLKNYKRPALQISLAAFLPEADLRVATEDSKRNVPEKSAVTKQEIERSILQQMLYGADSNSLPLSRFKRIQSPKWWSPFISFFIILGAFSCWHIIQNRAQLVDGSFFKPFDHTNWFNLTCFAVGLLFIWRTLHLLYVKSLGVSLKSISLKNVELTPEAAEEESILNRHLDEIIYFFQSTQYDLVIIEDLDRFNNADIFVTLREINSLINANDGVKRPIRFLYALRDNMFANTDRTKFFEFIVPVIPIINSSNSIDKVIEQGERLSLDDRLDRQFLREVSRYLNDLRLIQNIFNEYAIYVANLETDGENNLDTNKLLAILIYKNVLPSDFEALHQGKGKLANILSHHDDYVAETEARHKAQISEIEREISDAERQIPSNMEELRSIYAMALIKKIPQQHTKIGLSQRPNIPLGQISVHSDFEQIVGSTHLWCSSPHQGVDRIVIEGFQDEVNPSRNYQQRKEEIEHNSVEFIKSSLKTIGRLRTKISNLRTAKFNEIIRSNAKGTEELFGAFGENRELIRFLVFEGFLDDSYYQYTSLFHSGRLSPNDNKFLIQIRSFNNPEPDFQIDNPKEVIAAMRPDDFRQNFALNKALIDCMFSNNDDYAEQISKLVEFISLNFAECKAFFSVYYGSGKYVSELLSELLVKWADFVSTAINSSAHLTHMARMLAHLSEEDLKSLNKKDINVSSLLSQKITEILALGIDFDPERLKLLRFEILDLPSLEPYPAIAQVVFDEGSYVITIDNIEFIFRDILHSSEIVGLQTSHYSTVLRTENRALIDKIEQNFTGYFENVLLSIETNTEEDVAAITKVISHDEIESELLEQFIAMQSAKLSVLDQLPERLQSTVFRLQKIDATWKNCLSFISSQTFDPGVLSAFLEKNDTLEMLSSDSVDGDDATLPLRKFLLNNYRFEDANYRTYVKMLPQPFRQFPSEFSTEKLRILIAEGKVSFSSESFSFLDENQDLQVMFLADNIEAYFEEPDEYEVDDDFREKLLRSSISDDQKLKIIEEMDLDLVSNLPSRASVFGQILHRTGANISSLSDDTVQDIIISSNPIETQISLFNRFQGLLTDAQVWESLHRLPRPFSEIEKGWRQPTIPNTPENLAFVHWLEERSIISSSRETPFNEIRIYNRRK